MKVPEPKKLPSGSWRVRLQLGGEVISITRPTATACKAEARTMKSDFLAGRIRSTVPARDLTLKKIQEDYIAQNRAVLSPSTVRVYEIFAKQRWPKWRDRPLKDIDWQRMINDEMALDMKPKTVRNAWGLVTASMKAAGLPVPQVKLAAVPVNEIDFLQPEEILAFCSEVKGRNYEIAALLLLHGLRLSECTGLTWDSVDDARGIIRVHGALVRGPEGTTRKDTNKNRTSARDVPIMIPQLAGALTAGRPEGGGAGQPVAAQHPSVLLEDVKRASLRAVGREITCHGLRHSFASLCYHLGVNERQLMAWGGWADYSTMHRIYIRLAAASETAARDTVKSFFEPKKQDETDTKTDTD